MTTQRSQNISFAAIFLIALALTLYVLSPYIITIAVAATFAVIAWPVYMWFRQKLKGKKALSAILTVMLTLLVVALPLSLLIAQLAREATTLYETVSNQDVFSLGLAETIEMQIQNFFPQLDINLDEYITQGLNFLAGSIGGIAASTLSTLAFMFIGIIAYYYMLKDGDQFLRAIIRVSPLADKDDRQVMGRLKLAIDSVIRGTFLVAILQGFASAIGLAIFGVPNPILWGTIAGICALIPSVGTAIILVPSILYLYFAGHPLAALGLGIWALTAVGLLDNFLGPVVIGRSTRIHPFLILFSVLGGVGVFGPAGLLVGPLILSLFLALLDIYLPRRDSPLRD
jgi:predicted PurR-regulated permease PerM